MNQVILIGRLTKRPEQSFTPGGTCKVQFTLAVDGKTDKDGNQHTDFIRITVWGKSAENCARYLDKGRQVAVQGRIQTGSYDKDGKKIFTQDVIADRVEFLGGGQSEYRAEPTSDGYVPVEPEDSGFFAADEDDFPPF